MSGMLMLPDYRVRQRDYLLEISRAMTSQLDPDEVLRLILAASVSMLAGEIGLIALREADHTFRARATIGVEPDKLPVFKPLLESISENEQGALVYDQFDLKMRLVARALDMRLRQVVALPMTIRGDNVGVIFVFRSYIGEANPNDTIVLQSFADQAAIAVQNARLYQSIQDEQRRLAAIVDHSADGVMVMDGDLRVERINKALGRMAGWQPDAAIGQLHDSIITWDHIEHGQPLGAALAAGWPEQADKSPDEDAPQSLYVEGDLRRPDGTLISLGITYAGLVDDQGRLQNIVANVRDISHFRRAEEAKAAFISVISHELKTPVALIKGYASTLNRDDARWDKETLRRSLHIIEDETDRLTDLIENLLTASKLQAEGMRLTQIDDVDLAKVAANVVERFQTQIPNGKHRLTLDFPPDFPLVRGDSARLRQVFDNLVSNAIKYSPQGGEVRISGTFDAQSVTVAVSDQGVGIAPEELDNIFQRFYRVEGKLSRSTRGTGLGLYLARAVVRAHGGTIDVTSQPGKGSTFYVRLPRLPAR